MKVCHTFLIAFFILLRRAPAGSMQNLKCIENIYSRDMNITDESIAESNVRSIVECVATCGESNDCLSIQFGNRSKRCKIFSKDVLSGNVKGIGWKYYHCSRDCRLNENLCPVSRGYHYNHSICFCYKVYTDLQSHSSAVSSCASDGAVLARVTRHLRQAELERFLDGIYSNGPFWIQGRRHDNSKTWTLDDGSVLSYTNWNVGQPDLRDGEIHIVIQKHRNYKWHDGLDVYSFPYICEFIGA